MKRSRFFILGGLVLAAIFIIRFSLQYIPSLKVDSVMASVNGGGTIPTGTMSVLKSLYGKPIYSFTISSLEHAISDDPLVDTVQVKRRLPKTVEVIVILRRADAILVDEGGASYVVSGKDLIAMDKMDGAVYPESVLRIVVSSSYAAFLRKYGVDDSFHHILSLVAQISDETSLITTVKYDNNSSNSFGNVVLVLEPLNALVSVREKIDASRLSQALEVVKREQVGSIPSREPTRYDVYGSGMVRR